MSAGVIFDTVGIPPHDLRDFFRDGLADTLGRFEVESADGLPLRQVFRAWGPPASKVTVASSSGVRMKRLADAGDDDDAVTYNLVRSGTVVRQTQLRRSVEARVGEGFLDLLYEPFSFEASAPHEMGWITLSRRRLAARIVDVEAAALDTRTASPAAFALLSNYVSILENAGEGDNLGEHASDHLHDLVALVLGATRHAAIEASDAGVRAARRAAIAKYVATHALDPALGPAKIAAVFGLSDRYLRMIFEPDGGLPDLIARERVAFAQRILADPCLRTVKIVDIAFRCGFSSLSVFNRQFARVTGTTPSAYR